MRIVWSVLLCLVAIPDWMGEAHRPQIGPRLTFHAERVDLDFNDPHVSRVGDLVWLGGIKLVSSDPAFGGYSSLHVAGDRFTLLSDGGDIIRFAMGRDFKLHDQSWAKLPDGPGTGWVKRDRDSESMSVDPRTGDIWVGFESHNAFWRYDAGFRHALAHVEPPVMANWPENEGPEAMTLLPGGGMATINETTPWPGQLGRGGIVFFGDPVAHPRRGFRFNFVPPNGYDVTDMTVLPDGRWLILTRRFAQLRFSSKLTIVDARRIKPGATVRGRDIATIAAPLLHDNFEGVAATREAGATIVWLVSDDNQFALQRSLLFKFRLDPVGAR
ncbi:esterase-like activity of phytase family protein [Sphingomonas sp. RB3P16]|uniref:esterase-like activity of phytase family protein n=1 Tax=Parasphingomonas frigoris TaxID=3096163 RepID=UPI002FCCA347